MKRIIIFLLLFAALKVAGQTTGYLRFDTVKIMKQNGTCELYVINKTKDSLGLLTNVGGGLTRFIKSKVLDDSTVVIGLDTLVIPGATGGGATITLANVGTGHRLVTTPNGSVKSLVFGYGINGDSTTNANSITVLADTTELVTPSDLNDAIAGAGGALQQTMDLGNVTDRTYIYDSVSTASDGSPSEGYVFKILPLDRTGDPPPFTFGLGATKYDGITRRDNVAHIGWNLNAGGGPLISGEPFSGFSLEHTFIPVAGDTIALETHNFLGDYLGTQIRAESYTAHKMTDGKLSIDHYHAVGRSYLKVPYTDRVYFTTQPSATGASSNWTLSESKGFSLTYDSTYGVQADIVGTVSGLTKDFIFQNFDKVILPTMSVGNEIRVSDGATLRSENDNTTQLGDVSRRWSTVWGVDGNYSGTLRGSTHVVAGPGSINFTGAHLNVSNNANAGAIASIENNSTGNSAYEQLLFTQDIGANNYTELIHYNSGASGNIPGTSIPVASSFTINNLSGPGATPNQPIGFTGSSVFGIIGNTGSNFGFRHDAIGFRLGLNSTLHNSNTYSFAIGATDAMLLPVGTTAQRPTATAGLLRYNSDSTAIEYYNGSAWVKPSTSAGIISINTHTGPTITVQGGTALSVDNSVSNTVTFNVTPSSNSLPHTLDAVYTTAGNTGTSETDLFSYTLPAAKLGADGRTVNFEIDGEFNDNTITAQLRLYFAGNVTLNTGAVSVSTAFTRWKLTGYVIRTSSSTAHVTYELQCPGLATPLFLGYSNLTSLDFTTTNVFKISAQAAGGGASNSDITAHSWQLLYKPQPQ